MERDEAKQLLELCRPGSETDPSDPALAEAFGLLETDAELRAWFDEQQAVDARISESLGSLEVPADLKASILAGMRLHKAQQTTSAANTIVFPQEQETLLRGDTQRAWWRKPWIGVAAACAIALVILNVPTRTGSDSANRPSASASLVGLPPVIQFLSKEIDALEPSKFNKRDPQADNLRAYLASHQAPSPQSIPDCLSKMPTIGCITFEYENAKLSMICFKNGDVYHLIVADKASYPDALPDQPTVFQTEDKAFRLWVDGEQVKILTVHGSKEDIPEFI